MPTLIRRGAAAAGDRAGAGALLDTLRRLQPQRPQLRVLVAVLVLVFIVTGVLAWEAWASQRTARETVETTLTYHAEAALLRWRQLIDHTSYETARLTFQEAERAARHGEPHVRIVEAIDFERQCGVCAAGAVTGRFHVDLRNGGAVQLEGGGIEESTLLGVVAAANAALSSGSGPEVVRGLPASWLHGRLVTTAEGLRLVLFFMPERDGGEVEDAYGFVADAAVLEPFLALAAGQDDEYLAEPRRRDRPTSHFFEMVATAGDVEIFRTANAYGDQYSAHGEAPATAAGLRLAVRVNPDAAGLLIIGGLPGDRLPLILLLLGLTAVLTAAAAYVLRRESELTRLQQEFVANVSHELRTPLAQIRMFAETMILGRTRTATERRRSLEIIDQEARRLAHLVENVLLFARSERGRSTISPRPTPLALEIDQAIESFVPFCLPRRVRIRAELDRNVIAVADAYALRQILTNLLENALKYGPDGQEITVGLALFDTSARIWVDDEGPGIPRLQRARVFEPFYRVAGASERSIGGSGIGLAVVRELATLHGGRVWADEAPGGGARIVVELPDVQFADLPGPEIGAVA